MSDKKYQSFEEFYPFYLSQHGNGVCRSLHYLGSAIALFCLSLCVKHGELIYLLYGLLGGYGCAWIGHFFFEKNEPATFQYPWYSFLGDWRMLWDFLTGKLK
ncbi:DUF962 domain-containing protein [Thalassotalea eurytherma]|uniref:DUF962 domain-containing protein n=1 Tax=Thalassotalea eurytherma TaxID=1144278 RepID=A0ABQ6H2Q3_9GAMM|nr:DUF962 domain-containing protein [Thalassotalea eurytherma]GLX81151.1 hypothetical protein theurythT_06030 [Thalassotalea eurytherma]